MDGAADAAEPAADAAARTPPPAGPVELRAGRVRSLAHSGQGRAAVVELPGGRRVLTLDDTFDIDPGPMVRVYLVPRAVRGDGDVRDEVDLGPLRGSRGSQQYEIPRGVPLASVRTVVFWCVPFTQALAVADLRAS